MKRITLSVFICLCTVILILPVSAFAHSGNTDANGGHYDHSTWEYHYHHGMSAHNHYDINDDGYLDCPFEFDFNTIGVYEKTADKAYNEGYDEGYDIGWSNGNDDGWNSATHEYESKISELKEEHNKKIKSVRKATIFFTLAISAPLLITLTASTILERKEKEIEIVRKNQSDAESRAVLAENRVVLIESGKKPELAENVPSDVVLKHVIIPISSLTSPNCPYGSYTIYTSAHGSKYHCRRGCGNATKPSHFYLKDPDLEPCKNCVSRDMQHLSVPDWCKELNKNNKFIF